MKREGKESEKKIGRKFRAILIIRLSKKFLAVKVAESRQ
jgi:hypothetical protein